MAIGSGYISTINTTKDVLNPVSNNTRPSSPFITPLSLDDFFISTPLGSINKAIGNNLLGINHRQVPNMVSSNWDLYGLTFFTRPQLNLQSDNIRNVRQFYPLLNAANESIQKFVRLSLDPRLQWGYNILSSNGTGLLSSTIVDKFNAFIPVLTNNITSISGWPDIVAPTFTSDKGLYGQAYSQVDGSIKYYETFDLDVSFRNSRGDTIVYLFYIWLWYMSSVFEGYLVPYTDFIAENELDYCTRIYRLVLDPTRTYVKKIAATGASFPMSIPMGSFFEYNIEKPYNDQVKDITIRFRANGVTYMDDILIYEFNKTVGIFQPDLMSLLTANGTPNNLVQVDKSLLALFNNRGYPYINPDTYELQWWVDSALYADRIGAYESSSTVNKIQPTSNQQSIPIQPNVAN